MNKEGNKQLIISNRAKKQETLAKVVTTINEKNKVDIYFLMAELNLSRRYLVKLLGELIKEEVVEVYEYKAGITQKRNIYSLLRQNN